MTHAKSRNNVVLFTNILKLDLSETSAQTANATMFGMFNKKKIYMNQFKRAVAIENVLKMGIFSHQFEANGYNSTDKQPPSRDLLIYGASINRIFAGAMTSETLKSLHDEGITEQQIHSYAQQILNSDRDLERVVVRTLFDILSLSLLIEKDNWSNNVLANHPNLEEVVFSYRGQYPELFSDVTENEFKILFERFVKMYYPRMKDSTSNFF